MSDVERVVIAECLWPHEAGMLKGVLESAGIDAAVKGALSTSGEIPAPAASVSVCIGDELRAREVLEGIESGTEEFVCKTCGETAPAGFTECPLCAELVEAPEDQVPKQGGLVFFALLALIFLLYGLVRIIPHVFR